jgi:hypothetical protein
MNKKNLTKLDSFFTLIDNPNEAKSLYLGESGHFDSQPRHEYVDHKNFENKIHNYTATTTQLEV